MKLMKKTLLKRGFRSLGQLNGIRYLDFYVAQFLKRAKAYGYYDNFIFVFFGDHRSGMKKLNFIKNNEDALGMQVHHMPLFIHSPRHAQPKEITKFAKLIDIFPTATSLAKIEYTNYTLGRNLLDSTLISTAAFVYFQNKGEKVVGLLKDNYYLEKKQLKKSKFV
jgi:phosphoglycerol transferase MdoB-like AlkP superfamily enzyme|tara:strand:- start:1458 stop:1952 length:495 start_codon:yes stop_codon:yes gene_type:complete